MGYSQAELEDIQDHWKLRFPPDLLELMRRRRPLMPGGFDWLVSSPAEIQRILEWPLEGLWFDVQENGLWWPEWGEKPEAPLDQFNKLGDVVAKAPKLIPLYGHRYLPAAPHESGNPVFSVYQSDVIYYGADLEDWIAREVRGWGVGGAIDPAHPPKEIPFWSEMVRRNG